MVLLFLSWAFIFQCPQWDLVWLSLKWKDEKSIVRVWENYKPTVRRTTPEGAWMLNLGICL